MRRSCGDTTWLCSTCVREHDHVFVGSDSSKYDQHDQLAKQQGHVSTITPTPTLRYFLHCLDLTRHLMSLTALFRIDGNDPQEHAFRIRLDVKHEHSQKIRPTALRFPRSRLRFLNAFTDGVEYVSCTMKAFRLWACALACARARVCVCVCVCVCVYVCVRCSLFVFWWHIRETVWSHYV